MSLPPSRFNRSVWMDVAARRTTVRAERAVGEAPVDCVERFPTLTDEFVELVRFNSVGKVQLVMSVPSSEDMVPFVRWMNSWGRRRDRKALRIV